MFLRLTSFIFLLGRLLTRQPLLCTHISLPPLYHQSSGGDGGRKAVYPVMQNANVNFAERPTLMPRSPWLAEKEQKDQLMCLHVWRGAYLWFQWEVNKSAVATVPADNTKVVMLTLWVSAQHFEWVGACKSEGLLWLSLKTEMWIPFSQSQSGVWRRPCCWVGQSVQTHIL